jgi:DNA-binding winged helix-turn-helix (wHTH) protein
MAARGEYEFGPYHLDADGHSLFRNGDRVAVTPKALDVLIALNGGVTPDYHSPR